MSSIESALPVRTRGTAFEDGRDDQPIVVSGPELSEDACAGERRSATEDGRGDGPSVREFWSPDHGTCCNRACESPVVLC